jgi:hypothetical protein
MGYSCVTIATLVMDELMKQVREGVSANQFTTIGGRKYKGQNRIFFWQQGKEQPDGAMTGPVFVCLPDCMARCCGSYRIEPDGKITRFTGIPKKLWEIAETKAQEVFQKRYGA